MKAWSWVAVGVAVAAGWLFYGSRKRATAAGAAEATGGSSGPGGAADGVAEVPVFVPSSPPSRVFSAYGLSKDEVRTVGTSGTGSGKADYAYLMVEYPVGNAKVPEGGYDTFQVFPNQGKGGLWLFVRRKRGDRVASDWVKFQFVSDSPEGGGCSKLDPSTFDRSVRFEEPKSESVKGDWRKVVISKFKSGAFSDPETGLPIRGLVGSYEVRIERGGNVYVRWSGDSEDCGYATERAIFGAVSAP